MNRKQRARTDPCPLLSVALSFLVTRLVFVVPAMHVTVRYLFVGCGSHAGNLYVELQFFAGQRMIHIEPDVFVGHAVDPSKHGMPALIAKL